MATESSNDLRCGVLCLSASMRRSSIAYWIESAGPCMGQSAAKSFCRAVPARRSAPSIAAPATKSSSTGMKTIRNCAVRMRFLSEMSRIWSTRKPPSFVFLHSIIESGRRKGAFARAGQSFCFCKILFSFCFEMVAALFQTACYHKNCSKGTAKKRKAKSKSRYARRNPSWIWKR